MSSSDDPCSFQLHYIPYFSKNPDRHFLGFSKSCEMDNPHCRETREDLRHLVACWRSIRNSIKKDCDCTYSDFPLYFREQKSRYENKRTCVGFALLTIQDDHTEKSRSIRKVNRCVIQALFALPCRTGLETDASLIVRLSQDHINPGVPTLEELCIDIAALHFSEAQIAHLPLLLQKTIICSQKEKKMCDVSQECRWKKGW